MKSKKLLCGIDVSKTTLDLFYNDKTDKTYKFKVENNESGYTAIIKKLGRNRTYVMENTGAYSLAICMKLHKSKADVRVENPLVIKRFIQMNMERHKSDKSDARWIYYYGREREASVWHKPSREYFQCAQIIAAINLYTRNLTMITNHLSNYEYQPLACTYAKTSLKHIQELIKEEIKKLEIELDFVIGKWQGDQKENLSTIPSLGKRAISYLITYTDGFTKISNHRQLIALAGLAPRQFTSGSSVSVKKGICKMGNSNLRNTLYMCSLSAMRYNKTCKLLYDRLKAAGKPSKVALIAVCNKLIKQAFAVATKGIPYQEDYQSTYPEKIQTN